MSRIIVIGRKIVERMEVLTTPEACRLPNDPPKGPAPCRAPNAKWEANAPLRSGRRGNADRKALKNCGLDMSVDGQKVLFAATMTSSIGQ